MKISGISVSGCKTTKRKKKVQDRNIYVKQQHHVIYKSAEMKPDTVLTRAFTHDENNLLLLLSSLRRYWNDFLSCTSVAVADCQDEEVELWEKLKVQSGNLNYRGSLFQLCSKDSGAPGLGFTLERIVWAMTLSKLVMWVVFE